MKSADKAIQSLINDFSKYPNKYLTEDDVKIHLCHLLMPDFGGIEQTKDSDCSISLHTEVRWHGDRHLTYLSDIVLLDVVDMQVTKKKMLELKNHPEKGYAVNKIKGVIEIKFRRNKGDSDNQFLKKIKSDYDKLKEIKDMISTDNENQDTFYSLIVLDKKKDIKSRLNNFPNEIGVRYKFSDKCYKNT